MPAISGNICCTMFIILIHSVLWLCWLGDQQSTNVLLWKTYENQAYPGVISGEKNKNWRQWVVWKLLKVKVKVEVVVVIVVTVVVWEACTVHRCINLAWMKSAYAHVRCVHVCVCARVNNYRGNRTNFAILLSERLKMTVTQWGWGKLTGKKLPP